MLAFEYIDSPHNVGFDVVLRSIKLKYYFSAAASDRDPNEIQRSQVRPSPRCDIFYEQEQRAPRHSGHAFLPFGVNDRGPGPFK